MGAVLTLMMYFTPVQIANGTPEVTIMEFDTYAECEFYIEKNKPAIEKQLQDDLLGYSTNCSVN